MGFLLWEKIILQRWTQWAAVNMDILYSSEMKKVFLRSILTSWTLPGPIKVIAVKTSSCYFTSILFHFLCGPSQQKECPISSCGGWVGEMPGQLFPSLRRLWVNILTNIIYLTVKILPLYIVGQFRQIHPFLWFYSLIWITKLSQVITFFKRKVEDKCYSAFNLVSDVVTDQHYCMFYKNELCDIPQTALLITQILQGRRSPSVSKSKSHLYSEHMLRVWQNSTSNKTTSIWLAIPK